jgi:hypothetical protein
MTPKLINLIAKRKRNTMAYIIGVNEKTTIYRQEEFCEFLSDIMRMKKFYETQSKRNVEV